MNRILMPSDGPDSWQQFLAQSALQWAAGYGARTMAYAWEDADGFPPEVGSILFAAFGPTEFLLAIPEHKTPLPADGAKVSRTYSR